jgi:hypothetical protein
LSSKYLLIKKYQIFIKEILQYTLKSNKIYN